MGETRRREPGYGDPAPTVDDLAPRTVLIREADVWRPQVGGCVTWNGFGGKVVALDGRFADVEFDEPLYAGGDRLVKINIERLRSMDGDRPPASLKGMTIDAGKTALAAAAKGLALAIHKKIAQLNTQADGLKAEYRNMVKVCKLLGVSLDELPALRRLGERWTPERRKEAARLLAARNRLRLTGRGKVKA